MDYQELDVNLLENNEWNPNHMDKSAFNRLVDEIKEVGFIDPVQVVPVEGGKYRIIGGEHRVAAAKKLGFSSIPSVVLSGGEWQSEDLQKLVTVRLNMLKGKLNPEKMASLYNEMAHKYGADSLQNLFAVTDKDAWNHVVEDVSKGLIQAGLPKEDREKFKKKAKEAKTLADLEIILNELWSSYGDTVQQSFMIFTYGKKEHVYVAMTKQTKNALDAILDHCKMTYKDINDVIGPSLEAIAEVLKKDDALAKSLGSTKSKEDVEF